MVYFNKQTNKEYQCKKGLTPFVSTPQTALSGSSFFQSFNQKPLSIYLSALLLGGSLALGGCSNGGSDGGSSDTLNVDITSNVPSSVVAGNEAILDAEVNVNGGQAANAALFTLGADASDALATITAINYPSVSGVDFTQIIPNGTELPDCTVGLSLSNAAPSCMLKVSIEGQSGQTVDDDIEVVTDVQTLDIAIQTSFVNTGSTALPQGQVSNQVTVAPDSTVQITVSNAQSNTASFNNLHVTIPGWLAEIATNLQGGTVTTNEENDTTTITYTIEGANVDLAPGQTHAFSFELGGDQTTVDTLLDHYDEMIDNSDSDVIVVNASNLRNPLTPGLTVSLTPASMSPEEITLSAPDEPQTITVQNLSNSQLQINDINTDNLPEGVEIVDGPGTTCSTTEGEYIEPAGDAGDNCDIQLTVAATAIPAANKTLVIDYEDPQHNTFEDSTVVNIGGAEIIINGFNSIELPVSGDQTTDVTITNAGELNWTPSNLAANYEITQEDESTPAANISVTNGSGTNCLAGAAVAPAGTCNIGIEVNADDTATGNYVLSVLPANNLETTKTTNFTITEPTMGSFQFQDNEGDDITTQNFEIGDGAITIQVANEGAVDITSFNLTIPGKFTQADNTCDDDTTLEAQTSCSVDLSVVNGEGIGLGTYDIEATGDAATVDNSGQTLEATVQGAVVTFPDEISIPFPSGEDPTEAVITITNNGTNTIAWQPSGDLNNYTITGDNTTGISVVSTSDASACEANGEVAIDASCTIAIEVADTALEGTYSLTLALTDNLADEQSKNFEVTGPRGMFSFSPASITIGTDSTTQPQEITLSNNGATNITNVYLDLTALPMGFTVSQNTCGSSGAKLATLASDDSCTFEIAASNEVGQGNTVIIAAKGDEDTVENDEAEFETSIDGVAVEIQSINGDQAINRPAAGTQVTNVEITNLSDIDWTPSNQAGNYQISRVDEVAIANISIVAPDGETNCLAGADVAPDESCYVGIQTESNTPETGYNLTVLATGNLLPQNSPSAPFTIDESLGYFTYSGDGISNNELTLTIDADPVTVTLTNIGETTITGIATNTDADNDKFAVTNDDCNNQSLAYNAICTFDLALSGTAVADATYAFATTGDDASNSPAILEVTSEFDPLACSGGPLTVSNYEWAPNADLGAAAADAGVAGVNANGTMDWDTATGGFIDWLNTENYCGYSDWRIPSIGQYGCSAAAGVCDRSVAGGLLSDWNGASSPVSYLTNLGFTSVQFANYWSGTDSDTPGYAWDIYIANAGIGYGDKDGSNYYVLPVRATPRFVAYEGTTCLQDTETGLVWYNVGNTYQGTWTNLSTQFPQDDSGSDELCGQTDWKMPTLAEYGCDASAGTCSYNAGGLITGWNAAGACGGEDCNDPADYLNTNGFTSVQSTNYWSGTGSGFSIWALGMMSNGVVFTSGAAGSYFVLPVISAW
jgi:hypothetical protein